MYLNVLCHISFSVICASFFSQHAHTYVALQAVTFISHLLVEIPVYWVLDVVVGIIAEIKGDWAATRLGNGKVTLLQRLWEEDVQYEGYREGRGGRRRRSRSGNVIREEDGRSQWHTLEQQIRVMGDKRSQQVPMIRTVETLSLSLSVCVCVCFVGVHSLP